MPFPVTDTPLKRALAAEDLTYAWLARRLGVSRGTVKRWADGGHEPDASTKAAAAHHLRRDIADLWPDTAAQDLAA